MKKIVCVILALCFALMLASCGKSSGESSDAPETTQEDFSSRTIVRFTLESGETFDIALYPEHAPKTVENFLNLVNSGAYDGVIFHRVVDNFVAQAGAVEPSGRMRQADRIEGEMMANGYENPMKHERGVVSMARVGNDYNSASNQFFICYGTIDYLDGEYAAFGKVIDGMDVIDSFQKVEKVSGSSPVEPIIIEKAEVVSYE